MSKEKTIKIITIAMQFCPIPYAGSPSESYSIDSFH